MCLAGMGFGINPSIYNNQPGLYNALGGLQLILNSPDVKARTVISPHAYGFQVTGDLCLCHCCRLVFMNIEQGCAGCRSD